MESRPAKKERSLQVSWQSPAEATVREDVCSLEHDPEKWEPVFPRDKRRTRLRGDHAQIKEIERMTIQRKVIPLEAAAFLSTPLRSAARASSASAAPCWAARPTDSRT
jgi:hypothetical protein